MRSKAIISLVICLAMVLLTLAACNPTVPDEPSPRTPATPSASSSPPGSTLPPVGLPVSASGKWQTLSSGNEVLDLLVDGSEVWAATTGGVVCWNAGDGTYRRYATLEGLASNTAREIVRDEQGNIWVTSTMDGVSRFDGSQWQTFTTEDGLVNNDVITIAADNGGNVWVVRFRRSEPL